MTVRLADVGTWHSGGTPPKDRDELWDGGFPWISTRDLKQPELDGSTDTITEDAANRYSTTVPAGSLLIGTRGMALAKRLPVAMVTRAVAFNQDVKAIKPHPGISSKYLLYALLAFERPILALTDEAAHGTKRLDTDLLRGFRIPCPSLINQQRIADFLDAETARIDALVDARQRQSELLAERFARVRAERLYDLADPLTRVRRTIASAIGGVWGENPDGNARTDRRVVRVADFDYSSLGLRSEIPTVRSISRSLFEQRELRAGDLLIEKSGGGEQQNVGRVVLIRGELSNATCSNFIARLRPSERFDPGYLTHMHAWLYERGDAAATTNQTTGIQNLDLELYLNTSVPIPALGQQRVVAVELDLAMRRRDRSRAAISRQIVLLRERRQAVITAAVTGSLKVTGTSSANAAA